MPEAQHLRPNNGYYSKGPEPSIQERKATALDRIRSRFPFLHSKKGIALVVGVVLLIVGGGLAGLAALPQSSGSEDDARPIAEDSFFYGLSPGVYPSRKSPRSFRRPGFSYRD